MKILFCGDVVGKAGRKLVLSYLPKLKEQFKLDFIIVNGENAAHGFGISPKIYNSFLTAGANVITLGNHSFDKADIFPVLESENNIIRPMNYPENTIGKGFTILTTENGVKVAVLQLIGNVFMRTTDSAFEAVQKWLQTYKKGVDYDVLVVDFHAEATAEKVALGHYLDGHASLVVGTHTHIPTADAHVLSGGTAYISDVGMCGDYDSVIGMKKETAFPRFLTEAKRSRLEPAEKNSTFCAVITDIDEKTGYAKEIFPVRLGQILENTHEV